MHGEGTELIEKLWRHSVTFTSVENITSLLRQLSFLLDNWQWCMRMGLVFRLLWSNKGADTRDSSGMWNPPYSKPCFILHWSMSLWYNNSTGLSGRRWFLFYKKRFIKQNDIINCIMRENKIMNELRSSLNINHHIIAYSILDKVTIVEKNATV